MPRLLLLWRALYRRCRNPPLYRRAPPQDATARVLALRLPGVMQVPPPVRAEAEGRLLPWVRLSQSQGRRELLPRPQALQHGLQTEQES